MITVKHISLTLLIASLSNSCLVARYNPFSDMREHFERMENEFEKHFTSLKSASSDAMQLSMQEDEKKKMVAVTVTHLDTEMVDTEVNRTGNKLTLKTDNGMIVMQTKNNYISVAMEQTKEHKEDKDGKQQSMGSSYASSSYGQMVLHRLDLKNPTIDYAKDTKTLTINIPYAATQEEGSTKIPVNIK